MDMVDSLVLILTIVSLNSAGKASSSSNLLIASL